MRPLLVTRGGCLHSKVALPPRPVTLSSHSDIGYSILRPIYVAQSKGRAVNVFQKKQGQHGVALKQATETYFVQVLSPPLPFPSNIMLYQREYMGMSLVVAQAIYFNMD